MSQYAVVDFIEDHSVDVVPCLWIKDDVCLWPPYRNERLENAKKKCEEPKDSWMQYPVRLLHSFG